MRRPVGRRLPAGRREEGFTLVELLVSTVMGVVVMGAVASLMISAMRAQPAITGAADNISEARWALERLTREIRNGVVVDQAEPSKVSFQGYVRHSTCGGTTTLPSTSAPTKCEITYECSTTACMRSESAPGTYTGTPRTIFSGIDSSQVFTYVPSTAPTFVKITLRLPNPRGTGSLTVSDGASLRNATLAN